MSLSVSTSTSSRSSRRVSVAIACLIANLSNICDFRNHVYTLLSLVSAFDKHPLTFLGFSNTHLLSLAHSLVDFVTSHF